MTYPTANVTEAVVNAGLMEMQMGNVVEEAVAAPRLRAHVASLEAELASQRKYYEELVDELARERDLRASAERALLYRHHAGVPTQAVLTPGYTSAAAVTSSTLDFGAPGADSPTAAQGAPGAYVGPPVYNPGSGSAPPFDYAAGGS